MGKIKGWNKVKITHQPNPIRLKWKESVWVSDKSKIEINKTGNLGQYEYIRTWQGVTQGYLTFKSKEQAMKKAISYMRANPNG